MAAKAQTVWKGFAGKMSLSVVLFNGVYHGKADGRVICQADDQEACIRVLMKDLGKAGANYIGYEGARRRFLHFFPGGLSSSGYTAEERDYKVATRQDLERVAPLERALSGDADPAEVPKALARHKLNLLHSVESIRLSAVLKGPHGKAFLAASAAFTVAPDAAALTEISALLKTVSVAQWTAATLLPFLWRPDDHIFLKPEVTKDFAERVGHAFAHVYEPALKFATYLSLLDLVHETKRELVDLAPRDGIDVQSFIWVVGGYTEADKVAMEGRQRR